MSLGGEVCLLVIKCLRQREGLQDVNCIHKQYKAVLESHL